MMKAFREFLNWAEMESINALEMGKITTNIFRNITLLLLSTRNIGKPYFHNYFLFETPNNI